MSEAHGWSVRIASHVAVVALVIAALLWLPASFLSSCEDCDDFTGAQVVARMVVAFSPAWLLILAWLAFRSRAALVTFAIASSAMALVAVVLGTDLREGLATLGLSRAPGFALYGVPYAVAAVAAWWDLIRGVGRTPPSGDVDEH
jgi:hypothetical protein